MRILHLVSYPLYSGPVPGTLALALAQRRLGHTVWLACDTRRGNFDGFEEAVTPHLRGAHLEPPLPRRLSLSTHAHIGQHWADYRTLSRFLRPSHVDLVHTHLSHDHALAALCRDSRVPLVRTIHAARALTRRLGQRWLLRQAGHFIVRCAAHADALHQIVPAAQGRATVIPGSIDAGLWHAGSPELASATRHTWRAQHAIPQDALVVGQVALIAGRGQEELLAALTPDGPEATGQVHVVFVGDGEHAAALKAEVARRKLQHRVHFTGYLAAPALKMAYAGMDAALVMQAGNDAAVRAVLEAMAAGLPVLAPHVDALGEIVDETTGYSLAGRSPEAVAAGLKRWLDDVATGQARGQCAMGRVRRERHIAREAEASLALYSGLFARASSAG